MSLFKKKQKKQDENNENLGINKDFRVILKEKLTKGTTRTIRVFDVGRWKDPIDGVIYLKSIENQKDKINFLEIYPGDMKGFVKLSEENIKKKIVICKSILKKENILDDPSINQKNYEFDLLKLKAQLRAIKYNNDASYISFGADGQSELIYMRDSDNFTPFKWDTETGTIYQPSEAKKKSVVATLRNKKNKYSANDKVSATAFILLICGIVLTLGNVFGGVKLWSMYDESKIAELEADSLNTLNICSAVVSETNKELLITANEVKGIAETLKDKVTQPQITGLMPQ